MSVGRARSVQPLQSIEFLHYTEPARSLQFAHHTMPSALVVGRRTEASRDDCLGIDPFEKSIERQIEVQPGLFSVCDDVQAGRFLIVQRTHHRIVLCFGQIGRAETIEVPGRELEPARKRVTSDDRGTKRI
jgi:hypothetical protein